MSDCRTATLLSRPARCRIVDGHAGAVLRRRLEVVRADAGLPEYANQTMATNAVEREIGGEGVEEENDRADPQPSRCLRDRMAEDVSEPDPSSGPCQGA